jgi:PAS domain S-box-containing protein
MSTPLRLLLVEDSTTDAKLLLHALRRSGFAVDHVLVDDAIAMDRALEGGAFDLVISDWSMPRFSALAALELAKAKAPEVPFILVSGTIGEERAVEAVRAGASDFVLKGNLERLPRTIERSLREVEARAAHRRSDQALRESEARFRRLTEAGIVGILVADTDGTLLEGNDAYLTMIGHSRDDLARGVSLRELTPPEDRAITALRVRQLVEEGVSPPYEIESFRKDGSRVSLLTGAAMLQGSQFIACLADLTARKAAEAAQLEAERALRRTEVHLQQSQKMEAVGRLAGGVAHDFNNVLSVILSYSELVLSSLAPGDAMGDDVAEIRKAATRAAGLTQQLLVFSRRQVVVPQVLDVNEVINRMVAMLGRILGEDVELIVLPCREDTRVLADPTQIEQVVINLVVNARDAMPTGGKLTIETATVVLDAPTQPTQPSQPGEPDAARGPHVVVCVRDTGTGMSRETQTRIFEPFFTTKEVGQGTGLGLATVFAVVEQGRGSVEVESELGRGTTFRVSLPRVEAELATAPSPSLPATVRGVETILVVEDEDQVRTVIVTILRRHGYRVLAARHPGEALLLAEQKTEEIHLLLTDVVLPQMSGPSLASRLVALRPGLHVVFMSGYTDDILGRHGVHESGFTYLQKPITPVSLLGTLRTVLDEAPGRSPP